MTARRASRGSGGSGEFPALAKWSPGSELRQRLPPGPRGARHLPSPERESCSAFCPQVSLAFWISPPPPLPLYLPKQVLLEGASGKAHRGRGLGVLWRRLGMLQSRLGAPWLAGRRGGPGPEAPPLGSCARCGVVGTDAARLLCLARSQSCARPGEGGTNGGAEATLWFLAPPLAPTPNPLGFQNAADTGSVSAKSPQLGYLDAGGWPAALLRRPHTPFFWFSFLDAASLTGGCWEEGLTGEHRYGSVGDHLPSGFSCGLEGQSGVPEDPPPGPERPAPAHLRAAGEQAGVCWVGPLSGSLFAVTVLGARLSDTDTNPGAVNKSDDLEE